MSSNLFSEDTDALLVRQRLNGSHGRFDLSSFVATHASIGADARILDLGAGTGSLLLPHIRASEGASYCALDRSPSSLARLERDAFTAGLDVATICADMDALLDPEFAPDLADLSHVLAIYSLYYSRQALALLRALPKRLKLDGCVVIVGPAPGNNLEWFELLTRARVPLSGALLDISEKFFPDVVEPFAHKHFGHVVVKDAENPVVVGSPSELMAYWRSNTYHEPEYDQSIEDAASAAFQRGSFVITKRIRLVRMYGRRA